MVDSRLFLLRVWPRPDDFRAVLRGVDEQAAQLFTTPDTLVRYLGGLTPLPLAAAAREPRGLSPRESEVASLCEQGLTDKQISRRLGLATATVRNHVIHCYRKLGVNNRAALGHALRAQATLQSGGADAFAPSPSVQALPSMGSQPGPGLATCLGGTPAPAATPRQGTR